MENVVFTQLSIPEIRQMLRQELETYFKANKQTELTNPQTEQPLTIQQAADFLSLAVPTIYSKVSRGELPVMKRSKRLYFSRSELINYLKEGSKKTIDETVSEAGQYLINKKKRG